MESEGTSLPTQLEACLKYCQDKSYEVAYRFSEAYSGLSLDRPKLNELRELVRNEQIDVVVIYCLDRLSRNAAHGVIIRDELDKHQIMLESVTEDIDKTPLGEAIIFLRGTFSQLEAEKIRERTMRGKKAHLAKGSLPQGTGIGIYGYTWNKETKKREVYEYEASVVRDIFQRVAVGESLVSIARTLNQHSIPTKGKKAWHSLTIRRMVKNTAYIGETYFKNTLLPDTTPPIVDKDLFQIANNQLDRPKLRTGHSKNEYLLRNHGFCSICGKPLVGHCLNRKYRYYQCSSARPHENTIKLCPALYICANDLEKIVWEKTQGFSAP
jgi:site-specific DNA recombinase